MDNRQNKGFTLVELIVSIAILAIVTAPFLNAFVIAAKNNADANVKQIITNHSEAVMEKFKAKSFEALTAEYTLVDVSTLDSHAGEKVYYYDAVNDCYVFCVPSTELADGASSAYTAEVEMKPVKYSAPDLADIENEKTAILISEVYRSDDAAINNLYAQISGIPDGSKANAYKSTNPPDTVNSNIQKNTQRTVFIYITYEESLGARPYQVAVDVAYECSYSTAASVSCVYSDVFVNTYETVPDVLLFYTMYPYGDTVRDKIVVDNQIPDSKIIASGKKSKVYISNQAVALQSGKMLRYTTGASSNIFFQKYTADNAVIADDPANPTKFENDNTEAYMANGIYDATGVNKINTLVGTKESVQIYDLTVKVYWNNNLKSTVKSSTDAQG